MIDSPSKFTFGKVIAVGQYYYWK